MLCYLFLHIEAIQFMVKDLITFICIYSGKLFWICWDVIYCPMWNISKNHWFSVDTVWELKWGLVAYDWLDGSRTGRMRGFGWYRQVLSHRNQRAPVIAWEMPSSALQQLFPSLFLSHTHTPTHSCYCHLLHFDLYTHKPSSVISEICMLKCQMTHTFSLTNSLLYLTIPVVYFEWTFTENLLFCSVTKSRTIFSCLYWFRSDTLHCSILHISNSLQESRHTSQKKRRRERERERESKRERARERERETERDEKLLQNSIALLIRFATGKRLRQERCIFFFCLFPSLFHMIITSMCQSDIFVHWNALSCAGVAEIYGLDQKAVCDRNLWIYGYVIVPRHHTTAIYCLINKGMVNIITGANIACILVTDIFTAYQYGPHHAWYYLTSGLSNLGPELSCFMFHTGHILYPGLVIYLGQSSFKISHCSFKKQSCNFKNVVFYSAKEKKSKMTIKTFIL